MSATLQLKIGVVSLALALASLPGRAEDPARATAPAAAAADPALESFARMFGHEPARHTPAVPADAGTDPLIAALVLPLLRENAVAVAWVATTPQRR